MGELAHKINKINDFKEEVVLEKKLSVYLHEVLGRYRDNMAGEPVTNLYPMTMEVVEKALIEFALTECNFNVSRAVAMLGICRATLCSKIKKYNISVQNEN